VLELLRGWEADSETKSFVSSSGKAVHVGLQKGGERRRSPHQAEKIILQETRERSGLCGTTSCSKEEISVHQRDNSPCGRPAKGGGR